MKKWKGFATHLWQGTILLVPDVYGNDLYWLAEMEEYDM